MDPRARTLFQELVDLLLTCRVHGLPVILRGVCQGQWSRIFLSVGVYTHVMHQMTHTNVGLCLLRECAFRGCAAAAASRLGSSSCLHTPMENYPSHNGIWHWKYPFFNCRSHVLVNGMEHCLIVIELQCMGGAYHCSQH